MIAGVTAPAAFEGPPRVDEPPVYPPPPVAPAPPLPPTLALVDQLLRDRASVLARIEHGHELAALARVLLAAIVVGAAMFGVALGSHRGGVQLLYAAIKVPLALVATAAICAPTLTAVSRALGRPASLTRDLALLLTALAVGALVLLALAPVVLAARAAELGYHRTILLAAGCAALAAGGALWTLWRGVSWRGPVGRRTAVAVVAFVFALVGAQVSWTLRPFLVRPRTADVPFVRDLDGSLYDALRQSIRSANGLYDPPAPSWLDEVHAVSAVPAAAEAVPATEEPAP